MNFDEIINFRGTHSSKWDLMEKTYGVSADDGLAMWVADMDFRPPKCITDAIGAMADNGGYGYYGSDSDYRDAICNWMQKRHQWPVQPDWIFAVHGLGNGVGMCVETFTQPDDAVVLFTPVYHSFARIIKAAGRTVTECPPALTNGRYEMDFEDAQNRLTGREKMVILCSPHNPGGRVWSVSELQALADFCRRNDLLLLSDDIHHDLVHGREKYIAIPLAVPDIVDRLVMMTAPTKTFTIAGCHTGNVIIENQDLRDRFDAKMKALSISPNRFGMQMTVAAYSDEGAAWVDALNDYLAENCRIFNAGVNAIPGLKSMEMDATYLAWVDFSAIGMDMDQVIDRVQDHAKIAVNYGKVFGLGGEHFLRFNIACPKSQVIDAVSRLQSAFADLQ